TTAPIESSSRLSARPNRPDSNSSSSLTAASGSPATRAMPSPTSMTRPTWVSSTSGAKPSRFFLIAAVMSAVLIVSSAISEGLSELVQAGTDGAVEDGVADLGDDATHHGRVDDVADGDVDVRAGLGGPGEIGELGVGERHRGAHLGDGLASGGRGALGHRLGDGGQVADASGGDQHRGERHGGPRGLAVEQVLDDLGPAFHRQMERRAQIVEDLG